MTLYYIHMITKLFQKNQNTFLKIGDKSMPKKQNMGHRYSPVDCLAPNKAINVSIGGGEDLLINLRAESSCKHVLLVELHKT